MIGNDLEAAGWVIEEFDCDGTEPQEYARRLSASGPDSVESIVVHKGTNWFFASYRLDLDRHDLATLTISLGVAQKSLEAALDALIGAVKGYGLNMVDANKQAAGAS